MGAGNPVLEIDGMVSVQVTTVRNAIVILRPESADVVGGVEAKRIRMLTESIQVGIVWKIGTQSQVLGLEDDACS